MELGLLLSYFLLITLLAYHWIKNTRKEHVAKMHCFWCDGC